MSADRTGFFAGLLAGCLIAGFVGSLPDARAQEVRDSEAVANGIPNYDVAIEFFLKRIKAQPRSPSNYVMLAQRYSRKAKETGAEECYGLAEETRGDQRR